MQKIRILSTLLALVVVLLLSLGVIAIYSTTYCKDGDYYLYRQLMWVLVGAVMAVVTALLPMDFLSKYSKLIFFSVLIVLAYLAFANTCCMIVYKLARVSITRYFPFFTVRNGACRWLKLGPFLCQPSEFAKFAVILFLATYYGTRDIGRVESFREGFLIPFLLVGVLLSCILLGRSLSNTLITCSVAILLMFLAGVKGRYLITAAMLCLVLGVACVMLKPYRRQRILNYISKQQVEQEVVINAKKTNNDQLDASLCALGTGGITGQGFGNGRLKHRNIPESKTDFIGAVIGEELGFIGIASCILLYLAFMALAFGISRLARDRRSALLCMGVGFYIPFQAMLNLGVICGMLPTTGVTAPLVSYGGSSIVSVMLCIGLVFNVCRQVYNDEMKDVVVEPIHMPYSISHVTRHLPGRG